MTDSSNHPLRDTVHPALWTIATEWPIPKLGEQVLRMRAGGLEDRSAVNATIMVEVAAEQRTPAELAELVAEFDSAADDLARLALDAAAARRTTKTLADLASELVTYGLPGRADMLLEAVVRRRLPRETAGLLADLDGSAQTSLSAKLVGDLAEEDGKVFVVLWLAALGSPALAERYARRIADILQPAELAGFIRELHAYQDAPSAAAAVKSALGRDLGQVAELIGYVGGKDDEDTETTEGYATGLVTEALRILEPEDLIVLASLLQDGWQYGARIIWDTIVPDLEDARLIDALAKSKMLGGVREALRTAAETHPAERVAVIALDVEGKIADGRQIVLQTVAASRSIADIFALAEELDNRGYSGMAHEFLVQVAEVVHKRQNGAEVADFIDRFLSRPVEEARRRAFKRPENPQRGLISPILRRIAAERAPEQLMGMIAELTIRHRYNGCRRDIEREVAEHYGAAQLAELPLVRGRDYLLAVLEIELKAFDTPRGAAPEDIPGIVQALQKAGTPAESLRSMLAHTGGVRSFDVHEIVRALRRRNMTAEADWVRSGHSHHPPRPRFIAR